MHLRNSCRRVRSIGSVLLPRLVLGVALAAASCQSGGSIGPGGNASGGTSGGLKLDAPTSITIGNTALCGNGALDSNEQCDDGNKVSGDGCNAICQSEADYICSTPGQPCQYSGVCGNGILTSNKDCDDNNTASDDGCSSDCKLEPGWACRVPGKACKPTCGNGKVELGKQCDDGNTDSGDGCSSNCLIEPGASCTGAPSVCTKAVCGNGVTETGESCDCGTDGRRLPGGCKGVNGLFYGDGKGCSKTCTKEPVCMDGSGKTQACSSTCGDGNIDPGEACDDGNQVSGDGCSSACQVESGFSCSQTAHEDTSTCQSGTGKCLQLPIIYRDFQPENVSPGGHPDFPLLGTRYKGSTASTTICVPNSGGPAKGNDSTARCWGIAAPNLLHGKPQPGPTTTCECRFSDWSIGAIQIPGGYTAAANDSPLSDGKGGYVGGNLGTPFTTTSTMGTYTGTLAGFTQTGGPVFKGTAPAYKDAASFNQWFNDDPTVNKTFTGVLELKAIGSNVYRFSSKTHLSQGGFFPLNTLNPAQATQCMMWPYWNRYNGNPIWTTCFGDQYLFPPRVIQTDCPNQDPLSNGCWVAKIPGNKNDSYFTDEARYYFVYNGATGISLQFYGDDDLFVFINGVLVLDLGGVHQQLPGKVTVTDNPAVTKSPGDAEVTEGGCLDAAGNITGVTVGSHACSPTNALPPAATTPADFRVRTVPLGLTNGRVYEIAIFGGDRHPPESNYQLTINGYTTTKSDCQPRCGDGIASGGEECDCGDNSVSTPQGCLGPNNDTTYGGCTTKCKWGPFCGDSATQSPPEQCDLGKDNGSVKYGSQGCTASCQAPHACGDAIVDTANGEQCDLGTNNGKPDQPCDSSCQYIVF